MDANRLSNSRCGLALATLFAAAACGSSGAQPDDLRSGIGDPSSSGGAASSPSINGGAASGPSIGGGAGNPSVNGGAGSPSIGAGASTGGTGADGGPPAGGGTAVSFCYAFSADGDTAECACFASESDAQMAISAEPQLTATAVNNCDDPDLNCCCAVSTGCFCAPSDASVSCADYCASANSGAAQTVATCP